MVTTKSLLVGRDRGRSLVFVVSFAAVIAVALVGSLAALLLLPDHPATTWLYEDALSVLLLYVPAPVAAVGAYKRYGAPACLAVGVVPGFLFGILVGVSGMAGGPDFGGDPLLERSVGFALVGLSSAFVGYCTGVTAVLAIDTFNDDADADA